MNTEVMKTGWNRVPHKTNWIATGAVGVLTLALTSSPVPSFRNEFTISGSGWRTDNHLTARIISPVIPVLLHDEVPNLERMQITSAQVIQALHDQTQLTWDQIARFFGVSRRSVHAWAVGGRLSAPNEEAVIKVSNLLDKFSASGLTFFERRAALLQQMNSMKAETERNSDLDINRPALTWSEA